MIKSEDIELNNVCVKVFNDDCLNVLREMPSNSVDAIVSDPPYGISFMAKKWDYDVPSVEVWKEALRVLKPGGHALIACGTRTQHRMVCNIEDAGFEIRDVVSWIYGSGFPKSLNISKAIDKAAGAKGHDSVGFNVAGKTSGLGVIKRPELRSDHPDYVKPVGITLESKQWDGWGTALKPSCEFFTLCRKPLSEKTVAANVLKWGTGGINIDGCRVENKDLTGKRLNVESSSWEKDQNHYCSCANNASEKPKHSTLGIKVSSAVESADTSSIEKAKMPLADTSKEDIGCLDGTNQGNMFTNSSTEACGSQQTGESKMDMKSTTSTGTSSTIESRTCNACAKPITSHSTSANTSQGKKSSQQGESKQKNAESVGRFPANLIHDGSQEVMDLFPETKSAVRKPSESGKAQDGWGLGARKPQERGHDDQGSAARFFYCPKASKKDRNEGCEELEEKESKTLNEYKNPSEGRTASKSGSPKKNHHPTVKPTALMAYLCRLITPTGGVVLDPYMGSGSTGKAAVREGFSFVGIELDPDYYEIAKARVCS